MNSKIDIYHYEPNFIYPFNNLFIGSVKLIFCNITNENTDINKYLFILQNGNASCTNTIVKICENIQNRIVTHMNWDISRDFKTFIVNYLYNEDDQKELTTLNIQHNFESVSFEEELNFEDIGITKELLKDCLNDFILDAFTPYQLLNAKSYSNELRQPSKRYIKSNILYLLSKKVSSKDYGDRLFKAKLIYVCEKLINSLEKEAEINEGIIKNAISLEQNSNPENTDCLTEMLSLLPEVLIENRTFF